MDFEGGGVAEVLAAEGVDGGRVGDGRREQALVVGVPEQIAVVGAAVDGSGGGDVAVGNVEDFGILAGEDGKDDAGEGGEVALVGGEVDDGVARAELALELVGPEFAGVLAGAAEVGSAADEDEGFARGHGVADVGDELRSGRVEIALRLDRPEETDEVFERRAFAHDAAGEGAGGESEHEAEEKGPGRQRANRGAHPPGPAVKPTVRCRRRGSRGLRMRHRGKVSTAARTGRSSSG